MQHKFKVTGLGLKIDGVMIMPGSEVTLSAKAPAHWSRFGEPSVAQERKLEVATPEPSQQTEQPKRRGRPPRQESDE